MIDPTQSLAFSMQAAPGVYALLLGSGVSRAAGIPTGWEITLDLIRKLAHVSDELAEPTPERWYKANFGREPEYSQILQELGRTAAERQHLIRAYIEPSEREREEGKKVPTRAHRAIAALAKRNCVRVIVTTNFDRLIETALGEQGIAPTVLSSKHQVEGAVSLTHAGCTVLKLHGDYRDWEIKNTQDELQSYTDAVDQLLDRIFDEYGLVVCGWSGEWDGGLRKALERCQSHRFTTYWAARGELRDTARGLVQQRRAEVVQIEDADTFFESLNRQVQAIEDYLLPHPLSTEAAVANMKSYLLNPEDGIRLSDFVARTTDDAMERTRGTEFPVQDPRPTSELVAARLRRYDGACSVLVAAALVGGYWAKEDHFGLWRRGLQKLSSELPSDGYEVWANLSRYPAALLFYAAGTGALMANNLEFLSVLFDTRMNARHGGGESTAAGELALSFVGYPMGMGSGSLALEGVSDRVMPLHEWVVAVLWPHAHPFVADREAYHRIFDQLEILVALRCLYEREEKGASAVIPPGTFAVRRFSYNAACQSFRESLTKGGDSSSLVRSGLFGGTAEQCIRMLDLLDQSVESWNLPVFLR